MLSQTLLVRTGGLIELLSLECSALFLDVDGTLLEIRPKPSDVIADLALQDLLGRLQLPLKGALALVSGRMIEDLDRIFAPVILPAAGLHGAELRFADGVRTFAKAESMECLRPPIKAFLSAHQGLVLEDKGATLALHYRQRPELAEVILAFLAPLARQSGLAIQQGKMVFELKSAEADKGTAIAELLRTPPFFGRRPVFIGDDLTDEAGFAEVNKKGGLSLRIGEDETPTQALYRLQTPADLRRELAVLLEA